MRPVSRRAQSLRQVDEPFHTSGRPCSCAKGRLSPASPLRMSGRTLNGGPCRKVLRAVSVALRGEWTSQDGRAREGHADRSHDAFFDVSRAVGASRAGPRRKRSHKPSEAWQSHCRALVVPLCLESPVLRPWGTGYDRHLSAHPSQTAGLGPESPGRACPHYRKARLGKDRSGWLGHAGRGCR